MSKVKKILFITGTRADYGKMKSLIHAVENEQRFEAYIFVSGMHLISKLGNTYREIEKDGFTHIYTDFSQANSGNMSYDLGDVVCHLSSYVNKLEPDMIVVHGDRIDALAGAIVGAFNNIKVAHIEGGELSGTIDESIRHAISKFAHIHLVCNEEAKRRLIQMGERSNSIYVIGSPDIDIMLSANLPDMEKVRRKYDISFDRYAILMYHPVVTELSQLSEHIKNVVDAVLDSNHNYVVIYPNNDSGSEIILNEYRRFAGNNHIRMFPSMRFEYFLSLLKNTDYFIGNSSGGIRETGVYGIPSIDIGTRQNGRYGIEVKNVIHVGEDKYQILDAINKVDQYRYEESYYGDGKSTEKFMNVLNSDIIWKSEIQKRFVDIHRSTL